MRVEGVPRKVDHLGRVVVPVEFRRALDIRDGDEVAVAQEDDHLVLRKVAPFCALCGDGPDGLTAFKARWVCDPCLTELRMPVTPGAPPAGG